MSTHKHFDKICCVVLALTLIITLLFVNGEKLGIQKASTVYGYEKTLFDKTKVHTIDIVMDNWDEFIADCKSEEYYTCTVVIDGEAYKNVAIRGKGNTSLSQVSNDRYSYKIEFDHYDSTNTYYGLDKLCLNNIIQDNTYMKDYLTYTMMYDMGVASPLCSYAYITVNGEDWGLYLAVEAIEDAFLQRNYGNDYGELYKPDSMSMGGGRGNGDKFDMDEFMQSSDKTEEDSQKENEGSVTEQTKGNATEPTTEKEAESSTGETTSADEGGASDALQLPEGITPPENNGEGGSFGKELPEGFTFPEGMAPPENDGSFFGGEMPEGMTPPESSGASDSFGGQLPEGTKPDVSNLSENSEEATQGNSSQKDIFGSMTPPGFNDGELPDMNTDNFTMPSMDFRLDEETVRKAFQKLGIDESLLEGIDFDNITMADIQNIMSEVGEDKLFSLMQELGGNISFGGDNKGGGFGGMGSADVKLQYVDDNSDSYSNIFENAKTDITEADKVRLIEALKKLSSGEELADTVDIEAVIRYFVVHNFVVNGDSYTGSMIHNYYLYEKDGQLQMLPWDYNLAFGGFQSMGGATDTVNDPIDSPLSVDGSGDRPMADWMWSNEEYTELYHQYFNEFIEKYFDGGYFSEMIESVRSMISPYVEKDPTKFCTYGEFEKGISTLKEFCLLRAESVRGQLDGTIGSTSATQKNETLVDASGLQISDMGSMGMGGGKGGSGEDKKRPQEDSVSGDKSNIRPQRPTDETASAENGDGSVTMPQKDNNSQTTTEAAPSDAEASGETAEATTRPQKPDGASSGRGELLQQNNSFTPAALIMLGISVSVLVFGLVFSLSYKRRRR